MGCYNTGEFDPGEEFIRNIIASFCLNSNSYKQIKTVVSQHSVSGRVTLKEANKNIFSLFLKKDNEFCFKFHSAIFERVLNFLDTDNNSAKVLFHLIGFTRVDNNISFLEDLYEILNSLIGFNITFSNLLLYFEHFLSFYTVEVTQCLLEEMTDEHCRENVKYLLLYYYNKENTKQLAKMLVNGLTANNSDNVHITETMFVDHFKSKPSLDIIGIRNMYLAHEEFNLFAIAAKPGKS